MGWSNDIWSGWIAWFVGRLVSCCTCNTVISTKERMNGDTVICNVVYILSSAYIHVVVNL